MATKKKFRSLGQSMITWFLLMGLVPVCLVSWFGYQQVSVNLIQDAEIDLKTTSGLSAQFIHNWFDYRLMEVNSQAKSYNNVHLLEQLKSGLKRSNTTLGNYVKSYDWTKRVNDVKNNLVSFSRLYDDIYDVYLIDNDGNILYTVAQGTDLGTSLLNGSYAGSRFASAVKTTLETGKVGFSGLERYEPSNNRLAGFLVAPILDKSGKSLGIFAIQLHFDRIFNLLNSSLPTDYFLKNYLIDRDGRLQSPIAEDDWSDVLNRVIDTKQVTLLHKKLDELTTGAEA